MVSRRAPLPPRRLSAAAVLLVLVCAGAAAAAEPWFVDHPVTITQPTELGDVIVVSGGSLTVTGVPEPGLQMHGNLWVVGDGQLRLEDSVIEFESTYHGQYALAAGEQARVVVSRCDYRVPSGVQHGLVSAGHASITVEDTDFGFVQFVPLEESTFAARRCNGQFEVVVQHDAQVELADIPRDPDAGQLWVWPEFPAGSRAVYTPPLPGFVSDWSFPPPGATGIVQRIHLVRCDTLLWPMLVREGVHLTLKDIPQENHVVVGLFVPASTVITGLVNGVTAADATLPFSDREIRLENASIDTWNVYPEGRVRVVVEHSMIGEMLTSGEAVAVLRDTVVDGTGGYLGAGGSSTMILERCTTTCDIQATQDATIELHDSLVNPYPFDTTGVYTRFGAYDRARLLADQTPVSTTPALGGDGVIAATYLSDLPAHPPGPGTTVVLHGSAAQYSLTAAAGDGSWHLEARPRWGHGATILGQGSGIVENGELGRWSGADPASDYLLRLVLSDGEGRRLVGRSQVMGTFPGPASVPRTATPLPRAARRTDGPG